MQGVATTGVGPNPRERDFGGGPLLKQEPFLIIEKENRKGTVKQPMRLAGIELVRICFACAPQNVVTGIHHDTGVPQH
jgi:hypothetical protein